MGKQALASFLVLAATVAIGGCAQENSVVGRWKSGPTTFYFREDGKLFYRSALGEKYGGPYYVDALTDSLTVKSNLVALDGSKSLELEIEIEFLTADRMRVTDTARGGSRGLMFKRVEPADDEATEPG